MMKPMSFGETIFLFFLVLIIFGPKKLPEITRQAGKLLNEFRRASNEFKQQIEQEIAHLEIDKRQTMLPSSAPPAGTASRTLPEATPVEIDQTAESPDLKASASEVSTGNQSFENQSKIPTAIDAHDEPLFDGHDGKSLSSSTAPEASATSRAPQESHV
jgi:TatA/E family protein of Tat protein translocase